MKTLHEKPYFLFPNVLKRLSFQKIRTGIWSFLFYYQERWYFLSPKILSYSLDGKWKMIFLKNAPKTWSFQKKSPWNMISLVYLERWYFFPGKCEIFSFDGKWKISFSRNTGDMIFFVYTYKCYKYDITLLQKKEKWSFPEKSTLEADWRSISHSRQSSNDSTFMYFYGDLHRRFHMLLSTEKIIRKLNI